MNSDGQNCKADNDAKNYKNRGKSSRQSAHSQFDRYPSITPKVSKPHDNVSGTSDHELLTGMTRRSCGVGEKSAEIHKSARKGQCDKCCTQPPISALRKTVCKTRYGTTQEEKPSQIPSLDEKLRGPESLRPLSALKYDKTIKSPTLNYHEFRKAQQRTAREKSIPKSTKIARETILLPVKNVAQQVDKDKGCLSKRDQSPCPLLKEIKTVNKNQGSLYFKRHLEKVNVKGKLKLNNKQINDNVDSTNTSKNTDHIKKIDPKDDLGVKKILLCRSNHCVNNNIDGDEITNGAARTRIYKHEKRSKARKNLSSYNDSLHARKSSDFRDKLKLTNAETIKQNENDQDIKNTTSTKHDGKQNCNQSSHVVGDDEIISLYHRDMTSSESPSNFNEYRDYGQVSKNSIKGQEDDNSTSATTNDMNVKKQRRKCTDINLSHASICQSSQSTEIPLDREVPEQDEHKLIPDSIEKLDVKGDEIESPSSVIKMIESHDETTCYTNLKNYDYYSGQQNCKQLKNQQNIKIRPDADVSLATASAISSACNNSTKYNSIETLIHPAAGIHHFKGTLMSGHRSEVVLACANDRLQNSYQNSSSTHSFKESTITSLPHSMNQPENDLNTTVGPPTSISHEISDICLDQPPSNNSSNHIANNLKMKSLRYAKKYTHFQNPQRNMCCNMGRYIKRMISNDKKYRASKKRVNSEGKGVQITIGTHNPKTNQMKISNDRSSISVFCHSLIKRNGMTSKAGSSGGESSGYKSLKNDSNTRNVDLTDDIENIQSSNEITFHNPSILHIQQCIPLTQYGRSELLPQKAESMNPGKFFEPLCPEKSSQEDSNDAKRDSENQDDMHIEDLKEMYKSYDTNRYLSTFTNCLNIHIPCEITAYQLQEKDESRLLQFGNEESHAKNVDNIELQFRKFMINKNSSTQSELLDEKEPDELTIRSVEDISIARGEVMTLKKPEHSSYKSQELVINERYLQPDNPVVPSESTTIPPTLVQHRIITLRDLKNSQNVSEHSEILLMSENEFAIRKYMSQTDASSSYREIEINPSDKMSHGPCQATENIRPDKPRIRDGIYCGKQKNGTLAGSQDTNTIHELWKNNKSAIYSTDNESQSSRSCHCQKSNHRKHEDKFNLNLFQKFNPSASRKDVPLDQLPKPPPFFLDTSAVSHSEIYSSSASNSDISSELHVTTPSKLRINFTNLQTGTAPIDYTRTTQTSTTSTKEFSNQPVRSNVHATSRSESEKSSPGSTIAYKLPSRLPQRSQESQSVNPPPASVLPPPYPFCCPMLPYMMQYWQNQQQPPSPSMVPLPEINWKYDGALNRNVPPPPAMVPIPWFPPMTHMNNSPTSAGEIEVEEDSCVQPPPPEWLMMPRGYAPCLPCSRMLNSELVTDASIHEDNDRVLQRDEIKQNEKKKKVSNRLFKICRKKNKEVSDTLNVDERRNRQKSRTNTQPDHKIAILQKTQENYEDQSIWESPDIAGIVTPDEIGRCFRRGFRADGLTLAGDEYLCTKAPSDTISNQKDIFSFSDHDTPLDFLLALGFSVDEATAAIRDDDVRSRFKAALTEARIWVPHIATTQGTLLYLLAMKAKPKVMRYFLQLVEAIVNGRITNAVKLDAYLKILEKVEEGYVSFVTLFGKDAREDEEDTVVVEKQRRRIFYTIYKFAEAEAEAVDRPLTKADIDLLQSLAARYKAAIRPHLRLLACYIGEGILTKDIQLEAAVLYLSRLDSSDIQLTELEKYCGLVPSERRRLEQVAKTQLSEEL